MGRRKKREEAPLSLFSFQDIMACLTGILILVALLLAIDGLSDTMQATPGKSGAPVEADVAARLPELREQVAILKRSLDDRKGGKDVTQSEVDVLEDRVKQLAQEAERTRKRLEKADAELARITAEQEKVARRIQELRDRLAAAMRSEQEQALRERVKFRPGMRNAKSPVFVEPTFGGVAIGELDANRTPVRVADLRDPNADARIVGALGNRMPDTSYMVFVVHQDAIARFERLRDAMIRRGYEVGWQLWDGTPASFLDGAAESQGQVPLVLPDAAPAAPAATTAPPAKPANGGKP